MRRPRRNHTAAYKAKVALAALKGDKTLAELAEKYDVHGSQITQWKAQLLERADVIPEISSVMIWSPILVEGDRTHEEALFGRADHSFSAGW